MTKPLTGNEPTYPTTDIRQQEFPEANSVMTRVLNSGGMPIRLHLAAMAMQGLCAQITGLDDATPEGVAKWSLKHADALIAAYNKEPAHD